MRTDVVQSETDVNKSANIIAGALKFAVAKRKTLQAIDERVNMTAPRTIQNAIRNKKAIDEVAERYVEKQAGIIAGALKLGVAKKKIEAAKKRQQVEQIKVLYKPITSLQTGAAAAVDKPKIDMVEVRQKNLKSMLNTQIKNFTKKQVINEYLTEFPIQRTSAPLIDPRQEQINAIDKISDVIKTKLAKKQYEKTKQTAKRDAASKVIGKFYRKSLEDRGIYV